ncbi:hypothetical protein QYF61_004142 [Mycteria americana]|uniref:Uncharacterized protein n=1 Tax=Mycteria americana TaxID=33587 RepID=A0AAN7S2J4_MYCAM|nr:hypothetical protein QYF61_004142 [Mycteria americana]
MEMATGTPLPQGRLMGRGTSPPQVSEAREVRADKAPSESSVSVQCLNPCGSPTTKSVSVDKIVRAREELVERCSILHSGCSPVHFAVRTGTDFSLCWLALGYAEEQTRAYLIQQVVLKKGNFLLLRSTSTSVIAVKFNALHREFSIQQSQAETQEEAQGQGRNKRTCEMRSWQAASSLSLAFIFLLESIWALSNCLLRFTRDFTSDFILLITAKGKGWGLNHFPGQPVPMLDNPFSAVKFPNIQSKPPLEQLEAISSLEESDEVSPQPPFLQAKQSQLPQPLLIRLLLQALHQLRCPSLYALQYLNIPLVVGGPKLNTAFEVRPHQCRVQGHNHCPSPGGHAIPDTSQDAVGFLGHLGTLLAHIQPAVNQHAQVLLCRAAFQPLFPKPVALHGVAVPNKIGRKSYTPSYSVPELCHGPPEQKHQTGASRKAGGSQQRKIKAKGKLDSRRLQRLLRAATKAQLPSGRAEKVPAGVSDVEEMLGTSCVTPLTLFSFPTLLSHQLSLESSLTTPSTQLQAPGGRL